MGAGVEYQRDIAITPVDALIKCYPPKEELCITSVRARMGMDQKGFTAVPMPVWWQTEPMSISSQPEGLSFVSDMGPSLGITLSRLSEPLDSTSRLGLTLLLFPARFISKVQVNERGCWIWQGSTCCHPKYREHRYGQYVLWNPEEVGRKRRKLVMAHRFSYQTVHGEIPYLFEVDHKCRVKLCVNPEHLQAISHADNMKDRIIPIKRMSESCRLGALRMWERRRGQ